MKKIILTVLAISTILIGCGNTVTTTTNMTTETTIQSTTKVKRSPTDNDIIANATTEVKPNTWFRSGDYTYYMQANGKLAKDTNIVGSDNINNHEYVDNYGRLLTLNDFKEIEPYFIELLNKNQVLIPNNVFLSMGLNAQNVAYLAADYIDTNIGSWLQDTYQITPDGILLETKNMAGSINTYADFQEAMTKLKSLNLTSLDAIISYGFNNIAVDKTDEYADKETSPTFYPNLYGAVIKNKTNCDGFSHYLYWACKLNNIPVKMVGVTIKNPDGHTTNHALNQLYIDGEWKYFDLMWESTMTSYRKPMFFTNLNAYYSHDFINENTNLTVVPTKYGNIADCIN